MAVVVKNPPANAGNVRDIGFIPGLERFPGGGNGTSFQYSMDKGAWQAIVHSVTKSQA